VAGYSVPVFILAEAKRGTATFSQLNFLEIIFFRFRERFIDEGQYCLHRLPLFGIDLLHAVDTRLMDRHHLSVCRCAWNPASLRRLCRALSKNS
jgi:hypothetical protein